MAKLMMDNNISVDSIDEIRNLLKILEIVFKDTKDGQLVVNINKN